MLNVKQLREHIITPTLQALDMHSAAAEELVLATAIHESKLTCLAQYPTGPALGLYQMEPATYRWLVNDYLNRRPDIRAKILRHIGAERMPSAKALAGNLYLATAMCRLRYFIVEEPLPAIEDLHDMAAYWKRHYNTALGKGTVEKFVDDYLEVMA